ncbi:MAG: class B sortase [Coriobacteriaceae bacterium]|nr:class B sortase [Coriobacteriaceae bacterium]
MLRRAIIICLGTICVVAALGALLLAHEDVARDRALERVRAAVATGDEPMTAIDWQKVERELEGAAAWLEVGGTSISLPVMQATGDQGDDFYLTHDMLGQEDPEGAAYLDRRTRPGARAALIFGHHVIGSDTRMFSPIQHMHRPERFSALGKAHLTTSEGVCEYEPLCALEVDMAYPLQDMAYRANAGGIEDLAARLLEDASARADDARQARQSAKSILVLITCSSDEGGERGRTLVVFSR